MLGNNEQIQGVNLGEAFAQMVGELPWASLSAYIQSNSPLQKLCTIGGHRLVPDKRKRFEQIVIREAEKSAFSEAVTNGVFASWYPVHAELHKALEDYYHSDDYKAYREEKGLGEDDYVLPDEKLDALFKVDDLKIWKILLCFSPLKFTKEQAERLLNDNSGNEELVSRLKSLQESHDGMARRCEQMTAETNRLRAKQAEDANEIQELKRQLRQARQESEATRKQLEAAQAESQKVSQQMSTLDGARADFEKSLRTEMERAVARVQKELDRASQELQLWKTRYEEQRSGYRRLEDEMAALQKEKATLEAMASSNAEKLGEVQRFADLVLDRIDWTHVGASMKLTPTIRRHFNSLVKKLNYEDDRSLTLEGTLREFWDALWASETSLVNAMANSNIDEVASGSVSAYWEGLKPAFAEVQSSLEARIVLLGMLQDIFYQTMEMENLSDALLVKGKAKKKEE